MQQDLFIDKVLHKEENVQRSLFDMAMKLRNKELQIPEFQREFVWNINQVKSWVDSVRSGKAIGVIVTYQSTKKEDGNAIYLADGYQRLTSTIKFLDNPRGLNYSFGTDQAQSYCDAYSITVQHRLYDSHFDAMNAFQKLNLGTALTPAEFYRGELSLYQHGKYIIDKIPDVVKSTEEKFMTKTKRSRLQKSKGIRDSYALFYQYVTESKATSFWNVQSQKVDIGTNKSLVIERLLEEEIKNISEEELDKHINNFKNFLRSEVAMWEEWIDITGNKGKAMSLSVTRWLFHTGIWRKNTKRPMAIYSNFMTRLFQEYSKYPSISSRMLLPQKNEEEPTKFTSITMYEIATGVREFSEVFNIPLWNKPKRKKKVRTANGYHESHILPFDQHGNGETMIEPALKNISRGNKPIINIGNSISKE